MTVRKRLIWLAAVITVLFLSVIIRVGKLTIVDAETLTRRGQAQWTRTGAVTAERGSILDSQGGVLAKNATAYIVSVSPRSVRDEDALCDLLCPLLNLERETVKTKLKNRNYATVTLKRQVTRDVVDAIRDLARERPSALSGVTFEQDSVRFYPGGDSLSHVLGLTNIDGQGQSGLEQQYDAYLAGTPGRIVTEVDAKSRALPDGKSEFIPAERGADIKLTINGAVQAICERAMRECLAVNNARRVMALAMEPDTGRILAVAIQPSMDLNDPPRGELDALQDGMRIQAISDVYEPGSTFKVITAAAALDTGVTNPSEGFYCSGSIIVDGDRIRCWKNSHGSETMREALMNSCNPVFAELALRVGTDRLYHVFQRVRAGQKNGRRSAGRKRRAAHRPQVRQKRRPGAHRLRAERHGNAAADADRGQRNRQRRKPHAPLPRGGRNRRGRHGFEAYGPAGGGPSHFGGDKRDDARADGSRRGGRWRQKRAGGRIPRRRKNRHGAGLQKRPASRTTYTSVRSSDSHRWTIRRSRVLVIVDEAQVAVDYGGTTAAPFAGQILAESLQAMGVEPTESTERETVAVPSLKGLTTAEAAKLLKETGLRYVTDGEEQYVLDAAAG